MLTLYHSLLGLSYKWVAKNNRYLMNAGSLRSRYQSAGLAPSDNCEGESGGLLETGGIPWLVNA